MIQIKKYNLGDNKYPKTVNKGRYQLLHYKKIKLKEKENN